MAVPDRSNSKLVNNTQFVPIVANEDINDHYTEIIEWCEYHGIEAKFAGMWIVTDEVNQYSLWEISDPQHLVVFKLKWS